MINEALRQELIAEFNAIPPIEELEKMYTFSERHEKQMEAIFAELRRRERIEGYVRVIRKVAIIAIAVLAVVFASVKFVPEVYAYVKEWLMEVKEDRIRFQGKGAGENSGEAGEELRFELGYVPDGYELEREVEYESGGHKFCYKNSEDMTINLAYRHKTATSLVALNTEAILVEEADIGETKYYVFKSEEIRTIVAWEYGTYVIKLEGVLDVSQMLNIAASINVLENK